MTAAPVEIAERRTGRPTRDEIEARTPQGRAIHWFESRLAEMHRGLSHLFTAHDRETLIDAELDGKVRLAVVHLDAGNGLEARALLLEFLERDALRDAEHQAQHTYASAVQKVAQRIGGALERAAVLIRGGR